jgi:Protein of unknown function (DUF1569)
VKEHTRIGGHREPLDVPAGGAGEIGPELHPTKLPRKLLRAGPTCSPMGSTPYSTTRERQMKTLFERALADELKARTAHLSTNPPALWGKMSAAQAAAHCSEALAMASGDSKPPRMLIGRLFGGIIKNMAIGDDKPLKKNTPTAPELIVRDDRNLEQERVRLCAAIERFASAGPAGCTTHPHTFFGRLTPLEWANLQYKHVDHHLRQFGA